MHLFSVAEHPSFVDALRHFLKIVEEQQQWQPYPQNACFAVACPVDQQSYSFTNSNWKFSQQELISEMPATRVEVINDFTAIAMTIPTLQPQQWHQIGGSDGKLGAPISLLGPGTGLGVCTLVPLSGRWRVVDGEGGHIDFAPTSERQVNVLQQLQKRFSRVSVERLLSGAGIENIYSALCAVDGEAPHLRSAPAISEAAVQRKDAKAYETLSLFCSILGATAGNLALIAGALGGVYIAGGIVPRFLDFIDNSECRAQFEAKGRFKDYLSTIPLRVMLNEQPGLHGAQQWIHTKME